MSGKEGKRSKGRRNLYSQPKNSTNAAQSVATGLSSGVFPSSVGSGGVPTSSPFQPFGADLTMNVCDVETEFGLKLKSSPEDAEKITELMDAPADMDIPAHAINRGPNPYLDVCIYCNAPHTDSQEEDDGLELLDLQLDGNTVISSLTNPQPLNSWEIWTCANCRKVAGNFQSFLDANLLQASCDLSFLHDKLACVDRMSCSKCEEERTSHEIETQELQENWVELRSIVKDLYSGEEESVLSDEQGNRLKYLVDKLCSRDPHQLFLRLESQVREIVMGIKTSLLVKLHDSGYNTPELALDFTSSLLTHYELLTQKAHLLAQYLRGLSEHLRRFNVTWELLNKHLFHSIAHNDPAISNSGPTILEQLRQGSVLNLRSKDDPYCVVRKHLLKFQEEMSVVVVVWRDCQQLIENYCQEEVKNTQKQVSNKARSFISQQRQLLKEHLMKEPLMDEALADTMGNLMSGHKSSNERVLFHRCKRERCTCDECTITHMITCGIINSDKGEIPQPPNSFNFASDHTRNVMDITPPSMSSTTSSSGSVSPINIDDKLTTFYDCERALKEEFSDALLNCDIQEGKTPSFGDSNNDDIDENAGDDEDEDDDDEFPDRQDADCDEPHALQIPLIELSDGDAALSEAIQHQQQQLLLQQQLQHQHVSNEPSTEHNCAQCHQGMQCVFQPRIDPELSRQLDAELAKSGLLPGGAGDCRGDIVTNNIDDSGADIQGGGDSSVNSNACATCQCHACLKQSGHIISTSLPLQVPVSPPPAELHLYPHIHGPPQQHHQRYMFDLPSSLMPPIKLPVKLDFNDPGSMQDHMYHAYSDWDNTMQPRPGSLAAQHQHQHHQHLSALNSELLPPAPLATTAPLFCFDSLTLASHLATHTTHTSTTNTASAFKSVAGKHLASTILPTLNNIGNLTSEGSSVDPTKPLNFSAMAKIPQSCFNASSSASPSLSTSLPFPPSVLSSVTSNSTSGAPVGSKLNGLCHGPPCSRPATLGGNEVAASKWERGPPQNCKKFAVTNSTSGFLNKQNSAPPGGHQHQHGVWVVPFTEGAQTTPPPLAPPQAALKNLLPGIGVGHHHREDVFKLLPPVPCSHSSGPAQRPAAALPGCPLSSSPGSLVNSVSVPTPGGPSVPLACTNPNNLPAMVNNIGVGTTLPGSDPGWEVHHQDDNCDSVDDSCSEKSSSTSASNQKEGKYCDCCYCEFFGHNNTQVAKTSTNYAEMKDRLRKKLKKRNENKHKGPGPKNGILMCGGIQKDDLKDPLEKKGLEGLLSFINGTDDTAQGKQRDNKELTAKAAKRARQKQRKLEEKARLENSKSPNGKKREPEPECTLRQLQLNPSLNLGSQPGRDPKGNAKPKSGTGGGNKNLQTQESLHLGDPANSLRKQEITRSSLIIESTRPTISLTHKDVGKYPHVSPQKLLSNNNNGKETSQQMQQFIDVLQTLQNKQQEHQHQILKSASPAYSVSSQTASPAKANGAVNSAPHTKSVEVSKSSPVSSKQNQHSNQQQPQQQSVTKSVSGTVHVPLRSSGYSSKVATDVCLNARGSSNHHPVSNGSAKGFAAEVKGQQQQSTTAQANNASASTFTISTTSSSKSNGSGSPSAGSTSSTSQSPSCGTKASEQGKPGGKAKKNKKKNKNGDLSGVDEIFMPKSESELDGDVDEFERELEEFKRFCFEPAEPKEKRKLAVNVNLKDIFKKKTGLV